MQHHLLHSTKHVSGITTASEGLQRIQNMSFADKRKFVAHVRSLYAASEKRIVFTISKDAAAGIVSLTRNAYDKKAAQGLILRNSLQKAFQSF